MTTKFIEDQPCLLYTSSGKKAGEGIVELKIRRTGETLEVSKDEVVAKVRELMKQY